MTILYDARRPVNPARPFGAGLLPPDRPPALTRSPAPSPDDRAWWAAESARLDAARRARADRRTRPPAWPLSRSDRLRALVERARALDEFLCRERCDAPAADRPALDARRDRLARRLRRLYDAARAARRLDRHYDLLAAESAATDAVCRGLIPADLADHLARTSLVGHDA